MASDESVLVRSEARRLVERSKNLGSRIRESEEKIYLPIAFFGKLIDAEICEDPDWLAELNAIGCQCDKCNAEQSIVAVVRFSSIGTMAVCAECFQDLTRLSLGQVTS
ncbi:MAG TPA: hypothetical protein VMT64_09395 [Candidatus Binataceae bacterium]|nr:hypothetical protein [Candidatus Binataceae bacterium]